MNLLNLVNECVAVTEREIQCGMLESRDPTSTSFCITRRITNLMDNIHHVHAHKFIDIVPATSAADVTIDVNAQQMLTSLQQDKIAAVFTPQSIAHFDIRWENPDETNPNEDEDYLSGFMEVFECKMLALIEHAITQQRSVTCDAHVVEILQHLTVCRQRSQVHTTHPHACTPTHMHTWQWMTCRGESF